MRKVSIGPGRVAGQPAILLNNKPLFQHGTLDRGWWPDGLYTPPSEEAMKSDIVFLKKAGFNMLRKHIKIGRATSELQSLMRISSAVFCLKKKKTTKANSDITQHT